MSTRPTHEKELVNTGRPVSQQPKTQQANSGSTMNKKNVIFAVVIIVYEILSLPIYGVLFSIGDMKFSDADGVLLVGMTTILLIIGFGLINSYIVRSSFSGLTFTLVIFALTIQHWYLFRAFWNKAGANDYDLSQKGWSSAYGLVSLSNDQVDRQVNSNLPSGAFVDGIACAISLAVAFNPVVGRIGLLQIFFLTFFGSFFYEVNAELIFRWFIADNGFGCRIFMFGSVLGAITSLLLGKRQTTVNHTAYHSQYRIMSFGLLGFLFVIVALPLLNTIGLYSRTTPNSSIIFNSNINAWLAVFASVLGTFTANAMVYRKFSVFDLVFSGTAGAFACSMSFDTTFNPCVPLIVGYIVSFLSSIYPAQLNQKINKDGVLFTYPHVNRFLIPAFIASIVSAVVQACAHPGRKLDARTAIMQGGWQIVGLLISAGIAIIGGLIIGIIYKILSWNTMEDQFNDEFTYENVPNPYKETD